jgi:hypothetical protein
VIATSFGFEGDDARWIAHKLLAIVNFVPALFVAEDSAHFMLIRTMFTLLLIVLIVCVIAMLRPVSSALRAMWARRRVGTPAGR